MDLKFSFGASNPLPISGAGSLSTPSAGSSLLELRVSFVPDAAGEGGELVCEGLSGDGVSYGRAVKRVLGEDPAAFAAGLRSVLARGGAELPEPLLGSVTAIVLDLGGREAATVEALGFTASPGSAQLATVDSALQSRTGISAGTAITIAQH